MRLKCGPTMEEALAERERLRSWQPVFAWFPVEVDTGICVWLERVERRYPGAYVPEYGGHARTGLWVSYRLPAGKSTTQENDQ